MRCQSGLQALGIALEHPQNLRKAQAQRAKSHDFSAARHVIGPIRAPSRRVACGRYQAASLVRRNTLGDTPRRLAASEGFKNRCLVLKIHLIARQETAVIKADPRAGSSYFQHCSFWLQPQSSHAHEKSRPYLRSGGMVKGTQDGLTALCSSHRRQSVQQLVQRDRVVAHTDAGRVVHRVGHCRTHAADTQLTHALGFHG